MRVCLAPPSPELNGDSPTPKESSPTSPREDKPLPPPPTTQTTTTTPNNNIANNNNNNNSVVDEKEETKDTKDVKENDKKVEELYDIPVGMYFISI